MARTGNLLRLTLVLVALVFLLAAYIFLMRPEYLLPYYPDIASFDTAHLTLLWFSGAMLIVLAFGALLAIMRPARAASVITVLILVHVAIFILDIVVLAKGIPVPIKLILPEMIYTALVCVFLIRGYPSEVKMEDVAVAADALVGVVQDRMRKQDRFTEQVVKREEKQRKNFVQKLWNDLKHGDKED